MKYFYVFFITVLVIFTGCDGKDRAYKTSKEIIEDSNLSPSFFEQVKNIPENYTEVVTDTILSNGFRVKIKTYSDMLNSILKESKVDTIIQKSYYREFISEVEIYKDSIKIFSGIFDKSFFINEDIESRNKNFFEQVVFRQISLDINNINNFKDHTELYVSFYEPFLEAHYNYGMSFDQIGNLDIELINQISD